MRAVAWDLRRAAAEARIAPPMKPLLICASLLACLSGCTDPCLALAQKVCECLPTQAQIDSCKTSAANEKNSISISSQEQQTCSALLGKCDCHLLDTPQGKINCGQARDPNAQ